MVFGLDILFAMVLLVYVSHTAEQYTVFNEQ